MNEKVSELKELLKTSFKNPLWLAYYTWYSSYNPSNSLKKHSKYLDYYIKNEADINKILFEVSINPIDELKLIKEFEELPYPDTKVTSSIPNYSDASWEFALLIYLIVRVKKPEKILETGVGRGLSTYYILNALRLNGLGKLYSIDLPALIKNYEEEVGLYIPECLKKSWIFLRGPSLRIIKNQMEKFKGIDIFIHDSNHNYLYMKRECEIGFKLLKNNGILIADDVNNDSLYEIHKNYKSKLFSIIQEKQDPIVLLIKI
ncbi:MAG: class I SAM-dependent methyltransferase [Candidatus Marinimicrobia bacterium]|nr:class I SAM-dependent methyltransferase [Candidatus Neomarinimicrobiota bacterium]